MWTGLSPQEKAEVRHFLVNYAVSQHPKAAMVLNKLAKVIVDIARQDWPHNYPEFYDFVIQVGVLDGVVTQTVLLLRPSDHFGCDIMLHVTCHTLLDNSWIKLYVNIQVNWSGGPLNRL